MAPARWVDSHCHLFMHDADPELLLQRAGEAGVEWIMAPGIDLESSLRARALSVAFPDRVRWSVGLHPHDARKWESEGARLTSLATEAMAIGECGLDYYRNLSPPEVQLPVFRAQLRLAADLQKPIIIHCRDAFRDVYALLEDAGLGERAILHCWTGGRRWTRRFRELGVTFSFAGPITYPTGEAVRMAAAEAPPQRTMVETDTPYLTPPPDRHLPNEPANVVAVGHALADAWAVPSEEVARSTSETAARLFGAPR